MGKGMIIFGLLGVGSVIAGKSQNVYNFIGNLFADSRFIPTMLIVAALFVMASLTESKGGKMLVRGVAVLTAVSLIFSRYNNPKS